MHDEASTHYVAMVDQTTLGHQFLAKEFDGFCPRVGWQIDPFGHSSTQASLLSWGAGFDALFFGRIDYQDRELRQKNAQCEGVWRASPSLGDDAEVFWGLTGSYGGNYGAPDGFCFDSFCDTAEPVQDDTYLHDYNVDARVAQFVEAAVSQAEMTQGNHIMFTMGSDFQYEAASEWYSNLDKMIHYTNADEAAAKVVNVFYSTPTQYMEAKNAEQASATTSSKKKKEKKEGDDDATITWDVKTDDFFPYADSAHAYWTGYFTSRSTLKRYDRVVSGHLQAARQLEALSGQGVASSDTAMGAYPVPSAMFKKKKSKQEGDKEEEEEEEGSNIEVVRVAAVGGDPPAPFMESPLGVLQAASGVNQHHDAVSGTSKQHVAYDYAQRMAAGVDNAADMVAAALDVLTGQLNPEALVSSSSSSSSGLAQCALLNVSVCAATQKVESGDAVAVVAYNPLAKVRGELLMLPVSAAPTSVVDADTGDSIAFQVMEAAWSPNANAAPFTLAFKTGDIEPLSAKQMVVFFDDDDSSSSSSSSTTAILRPEPMVLVRGDGSTSKSGKATTNSFEVSNGVVSLTVSNETGRLVGMSYANPNGEDGGDDAASIDLDQFFGYYTSFAGGLEGLDLGDCDPNTWEGCPEQTTQELERRRYRRRDPRLAEAIRAQQLKAKMGPVALHTSTAHHARSSHGNHQHHLLHDVVDLTDDDTQNSGAYIFRPETPEQTATLIGETATVEVIVGPIVTEVRQSFASWMNQTIRLVEGQLHATLEFTVGAIPLDDGKGKEVITRLSSSVNNLADSSDAETPQIYTDSNGREFLQRTYNFRETWDLLNAEPVAGNYYPMNAAAYIKDEAAQLSILTDRSQGVASLAQGQVEVLIQRRLLADDSRGVGEPLNETDVGITSYADSDCAACREGDGVVVRGSHILQLHKPEYAMKHLRSDADMVFLPMLTAFDQARGDSKKKKQLAALAVAAKAKEAAATTTTTTPAALPANVKLLTLQAASDSSLLLRLEHAFALGEDATLSLPATVNITAFLGSLGFSVSGAVELTLTGNQPLEDLTRLHWNTGTAGGQDTETSSSSSSSSSKVEDVRRSMHENARRKRDAARAKAKEMARAGLGDGVVTLGPQEIRTALVSLSEPLAAAAKKRFATNQA